MLCVAKLKVAAAVVAAATAVTGGGVAVYQVTGDDGMNAAGATAVAQAKPARPAVKPGSEVPKANAEESRGDRWIPSTTVSPRKIDVIEGRILTVTPYMANRPGACADITIDKGRNHGVVRASRVQVRRDERLINCASVFTLKDETSIGPVYWGESNPSWKGSPAVGDKVKIWPAGPFETVKGLQLTLTAESNHIFVGPDGLGDEPTRLYLQYGNVGKTPIKLNRYLLTSRYGPLTFDVRGPDNKTVEPKSTGIRWRPEAPGERHFITIAGTRLSESSKLTLPGRVGLDFEYRLVQPGQYAVSAVYAYEGPHFWAPELAKGCWEGELTSNEILLNVHRIPEQIIRQKAETIALAKAREHFQNEPDRLKNLQVSDPLRLTLRGDRVVWWVEYSGDNGLTGKWVEVYIDPETGKAETARSPKKGA
jgi:hypothetical protein